MPLGAFRQNTLAKFVSQDSLVTRERASITAVGDAQVDTAQSKFGGASALFDGNNDYLTVSGDLSSVGFTLEAWCRFDILPSSQTLAGGNYMMLATASSATYFMIRNDSVQIAHAGSYFTISGLPTVSTNTWYHYAFVQESNGDWSVFLDGVRYNNNQNKATAILGSSLTIGRFIDSRGSWDGHIDEFRISNIARYTANFTPPTEPFQNDENTLLLLHMDGTDRSTVFVDDNSLVNPDVTGGDVTFLAVENDQLYRVHQFNSSGTLVANESVTADVLLVGGGGGGGYGTYGTHARSSGGAGGLVYSTGVAVSAASHTINVGAGGPSSTGTVTAGTCSAFGLSAFGGQNPSTADNSANRGGLPQGFSNGNGRQWGSTAYNYGGGGAGAGGPGTNWYDGHGGDGGPGVANSITGTSVIYANGRGGSGGGTDAPGSDIGSGGYDGRTGKTGIVIVRYPV